jgi:hypothetical protein
MPRKPMAKRPQDLTSLPAAIEPSITKCTAPPGEP